MARIGIWAHHEPSHVAPMLPLARALRDRGHRVTLIGLPDLAISLGRFSDAPELVTFGSREFPPGKLAELYALARDGNSPRSAVGAAAQVRAAMISALSALQDLRFAPIHPEGPPDLYLVDTVWTLAATAAVGSGVPTILANICLPYGRRPNVPPLTSSHRPATTPWERLSVRKEWMVANARRLVVDRWMRALGAGDLMAFARRSGVPRSAFVQGGQYGPILQGPELIFCPEAFDVGAGNPPDRHYVEASIENSWTPTPFPWERVDSRKRLVYCSLGTYVAESYPTARELLRTLAAAARAWPEQQLVIAAGTKAMADELDVQHPHVIATPFAPQLELLARSDLFITHAGLGGVKEALFHGVPMVAIPFAFDQRGNAMRLALHGLGRWAEPSIRDGRALVGMVRSVLDDRTYAARARAMSLVFQRMERERPSIGIIERRLMGASPTDDSAGPSTS